MTIPKTSPSCSRKRMLKKQTVENKNWRIK